MWPISTARSIQARKIRAEAIAKTCLSENHTQKALPAELLQLGSCYTFKFPEMEKLRHRKSVQSVTFSHCRSRELSLTYDRFIVKFVLLKH